METSNWLASAIAPADTPFPTLLGAIIALVLGGIIALLPNCWKRAFPARRVRKLTTWRIRGIPNNVSEDELRKKLQQSFSDISKHAKLQNLSILSLSLANSSLEYKCATVTSASPPLSYDVESCPVDTEFLGITPLSQPDHATSDGIVDIIAVPGLGSHAWGSFKSSKGWKAWLRDFLPNEIPRARVLLYGYDTKLAKSKSKSSILDLSKELLERVRTFRDDTQTQQRPIVFIGHSLGGLLIKEALAIANNHRGSCTSRDSCDTCDIFMAAYGLMFFGVPNLGLRNEQLCELVDGQPNKPFIDSLVTDQDSEASHYLKELREKFVLTCKAQEFGIISYYERDESPTVQVLPDGRLVKSGPRRQLVTQESACQIGATENFHRSLPLERDHSGLVKFDSKHDEDYIGVRKRLKDLVNTTLQAVSNRFDSVKELLPDQKRIWSDFNRPPYDDIRKNNIAKPEPGTLTWLTGNESTPEYQMTQARPQSILCREDFTTWRDSARSESLLILAPPGRGKSVLSNFVIGHLQAFPPKSKTIYYFCSIRYPDELQTGSALLRALIAQLSEDRRVFQQLPASFEQNTENFAKASLPDLWSIFEKALREYPSERVYCVVDGLDVYGDRMENLALRLKTFFNREHPKDAGWKPFLKLFCTSRDQENIRSAFEGSLIRRFFPDDDDLRVFIKERSTNLRNLSDEQKKLVHNKLIQKAGKTFLWLDVVVRSLQALSCPSKSDIEAAIDRAPMDLAEFYHLKVDEICKDLRNRLILVWVVYAKWSLSLPELADAVALGSSNNFTCYFDCENNRPYLTADGLRNSLGALLDIIDEKVYLIHQSLKDFFEESKALWPRPDTGPEPRLEIAKICMRYLALDDFASEQNVKDLVQNNPKLGKKYSLLKYAAEKWFLHIEAPNEVLKVEAPLPKLLRSHNPNTELWVNLIRKPIPRGLERRLVLILHSLGRAFPVPKISVRPCDIAIEFDICWLAEMILAKHEQVWTSPEESFDVDCLHQARKDSTRVLKTFLTHETTKHLQVTARTLEHAAETEIGGEEGALSLFLRYRKEDIKVTEKVLQCATRNSRMPHETLELYFRHAKNAPITEDILITAAENSNGEEVMEYLFSRDTNIQITERILGVAASNLDGKGVVKLLLQHDPDIQITEHILVAAAENRWDGYEILRFLFSRNPNIQVTERILIGAAREEFQGGEKLQFLLSPEHTLRPPVDPEYEILQFLLSHDPNIQVTKRILVAAAENAGDGYKILQSLMSHDPNIQVTERVLVAAARKAEDGYKILQSLMSHDSTIQVTERILEAAINNPFQGPQIWQFLFSHNPNIQITERVLIAAASNRWAGNEILEIIFSHDPGVQITERVLIAAASNRWAGNEILEIIFSHDPSVQITERILIAAASNFWAWEKILRFLFSHDPNIQITERILEAAKSNKVKNRKKILEFLLSRDPNIQVTERLVEVAGGATES